MLHSCHSCGRIYVRSRWCPNCYDDYGQARARFSPCPNSEIADIWSGGICYFILREQERGGAMMAQVIRADGIVEPMRWLDIVAAIQGD